MKFNDVEASKNLSEDFYFNLVFAFVLLYPSIFAVILKDPLHVSYFYCYILGWLSFLIFTIILEKITEYY
jgi:hypothetical protein